MDDRTTEGQEMAWEWGILKFCLLKWYILVYLSYYFAQLTGLMWSS